MKKRMLAALLAGSMLLTACGGTGGQTASQAPKGEAPQSASADAGTQSGQKVTMKVSVGVADNHFEAVAVNKMKEYIEEQTGGNFTVEIFTGAQIGNDQEVFEGLKLGVADMLPCGTDIIGNFSKDFGLLSLPYLFDNEKQVEAVVEGEFGQSLLKELESGIWKLWLPPYNQQQTSNQQRGGHERIKNKDHDHADTSGGV